MWAIFIGFTVAIAFVALAATCYDFYNPVNIDVNIIVEPVTEIRFDHPNDIEMQTITEISTNTNSSHDITEINGNIHNVEINNVENVVDESSRTSVDITNKT